MLAVIIKNLKRRASFLVFLRGNFGELLLGKLILNADNDAGVYYEDQGTGSFRVAVSYSTEDPLRFLLPHLTISTTRVQVAVSYSTEDPLRLTSHFKNGC